MFKEKDKQILACGEFFAAKCFTEFCFFSLRPPCSTTSK